MFLGLSVRDCVRACISPGRASCWWRSKVKHLSELLRRAEASMSTLGRRFIVLLHCNQFQFLTCKCRWRLSRCIWHIDDNWRRTCYRSVGHRLVIVDRDVLAPMEAIQSAGTSCTRCLSKTQEPRVCVCCASPWRLRHLRQLPQTRRHRYPGTTYFTEVYYTRAGSFNDKFDDSACRCSYSQVNFFSSGVVNVWNSLPESASFMSLSVFKHTLTTIDLSKFLKCFSYIRLRAAVSVSC